MKKMMKRVFFRTLTLGFALLLCVFACISAVGAKPTAPKLILQITVDQLRGDLPMRFNDSQ